MKSGAVDGKLGIGRRRRAGRAEGVFRLLLSIRHFTYKMVRLPRVKLPWMAVSESTGQDVRCFRPGRFQRFTHFISEI